MRKNTCSGWTYHQETNHVIDKDLNGDAIGCHTADRKQKWYCSECRHQDAGEMPMEMN